MISKSGFQKFVLILTRIVGQNSFLTFTTNEISLDATWDERAKNVLCKSLKLISTRKYFAEPFQFNFSGRFVVKLMFECLKSIDSEFVLLSLSSKLYAKFPLTNKYLFEY